jgi:hypothetical protein
MGSLRELYYVTQKSQKSQKITRCASWGGQVDIFCGRDAAAPNF